MTDLTTPSARVLIALVFAISLAAPVQADDQLRDYSLSVFASDSDPATPLTFSGSDIYRLGGTAPRVESSLDPEFSLLPSTEGIYYTTRFRLEQQAQFQDEDQYSLVSRQLQIGYGADTPIGYHGVNLSLEQFDTSEITSPSDLWSLGWVTRGRFKVNGLGTAAPLWQLTLAGEFEQYTIDEASFENWTKRGDWFVTPSLHWSINDYSLSAGIRMPLDFLSDDLEGEPDYRIRADFKHRF
ncbi:MAG: hypothetical protein AAF420_00055 [Pseudomonadota bacterium]